MPMIKIDDSELTPRNGSEKLPAPTLPYWSNVGIKLGDALLCNGYVRTMALVRRLRLRRLFISSRQSEVPPLAPAFAQELRARMRGEIEALEGLLNADLSVWKTGKPAERRLEVRDRPLTGLSRNVEGVNTGSGYSRAYGLASTVGGQEHAAELDRAPKPRQ
jgi:hypothetical protein